MDRTIMSEQIEALHRLFEGVWNGKDPAIADELVGSEYVIHDRDIANELRGPELYKTLASMTRERYSEMTFTIEDTVEEDDTVALRWTMTGTHENGNEVTLPAIGINRFEDGKLVESWTQSDTRRLTEQLER